MKFIVSKRNYYEPTPKNMRKLGDALLASATFAMTMITPQYPAIGMALMIMGVVGKFLSNFFTNSSHKTPIQ